MEKYFLYGWVNGTYSNPPDRQAGLFILSEIEGFCIEKAPPAAGPLLENYTAFAMFKLA